MRLQDLKSIHAPSPENQFLETREDVEAWVRENVKTVKWDINKDLTVDIGGSIDMTHINYYFPIRFGVIDGNFKCSNLITFRGCPEVVDSFSFQGEKFSPSIWEGIPQQIKGSLDLQGGLVPKTLHNLFKHTKEIGWRIFCNHKTTNILGVMLIGRLKEIVPTTKYRTSVHKIDKTPFDIVNNFLKRREVEDVTIHDCQEALLEAGYPRHAQL